MERGHFKVLWENNSVTLLLIFHYCEVLYHCRKRRTQYTTWEVGKLLPVALSILAREHFDITVNLRGRPRKHRCSNCPRMLPIVACAGTEYPEGLARPSPQICR